MSPGMMITAIENARKQSQEYGLDRIMMTIEFADMVIELLKKQEPMEPETFMDGPVKRYACKVCGTHLMSVGRHRDRFCRMCGQAVKWE